MPIQQLLTSSSIETNNPPPHLAPQKSIEIIPIGSKKEEEIKLTQPWKRETNLKKRKANYCWCDFVFAGDDNTHCWHMKKHKKNFQIH
jgi:hypothetical protein